MRSLHRQRKTLNEEAGDPVVSVWFSERAFLAVVFGYAVIAKAKDMGEFSRFLAQNQSLRLLPPGIAAGVVMAGETALAILLVLGWHLLFVSSATVAVLIGMSVFIVRQLSVAPEASCHCFGRSSHPIGFGAVARDMFLLGIAVSLAIASAVPAEAPNAPVGAFISLHQALPIIGMLLLGGLLCGLLGNLDGAAGAIWPTPAPTANGGEAQ